jgi:hypothetical protein
LLGANKLLGKKQIPVTKLPEEAANWKANSELMMKVPIFVVQTGDITVTRRIRAVVAADTLQDV